MESQHIGSPDKSYQLQPPQDIPADVIVKSPISVPNLTQFGQSTLGQESFPTIEVESRTVKDQNLQKSTFETHIVRYQSSEEKKILKQVRSQISRIIKSKNEYLLSIAIAKSDSTNNAQNLVEAKKILNWYNIEHVMIVPYDQKNFELLDNYLEEALLKMKIENPKDFETFAKITSDIAARISNQDLLIAKNYEQINIVIERIKTLKQAFRHIILPTHFAPPNNSPLLFEFDHDLVDNIQKNKQVLDFVQKIASTDLKQARDFIIENSDEYAFKKLVEILGYSGKDASDRFLANLGVPALAITFIVFISLNIEYCKNIFSPKLQPQQTNSETKLHHKENSVPNVDILDSEPKQGSNSHPSLLREYLENLKLNRKNQTQSHNADKVDDGH